MPDPGQLSLRYSALIKEWNEKFNLVSAGDLDKLEERHVQDALKLPELYPELNFKTAIDVGSGAGFPGLPLGFYYPERDFTLLESIGKKADFLRAAASALELKRVAVIIGRAEELGRNPDHRDRYGLAVARALAHPASALELTLPFVAPGGAAVYWASGPLWEDKALISKVARELGGQWGEERFYKLSDGRDRKLVLIKKAEPTPEKYPRRTGIPVKNPLK